jgi:hypothetical protein
LASDQAGPAGSSPDHRADLDPAEKEKTDNMPNPLYFIPFCFNFNKTKQVSFLYYKISNKFINPFEFICEPCTFVF